MMEGMYPHGGMMIWMFIWWTLIAIGIAVLVYWVTKKNSNQQEKNNQKDPSLELLRKRFAAGDISKEEFKEKKRILGWS